jgi:hypothetical protein
VAKEGETHDSWRTKPDESSPTTTNASDSTLAMTNGNEFHPTTMNAGQSTQSMMNPLKDDQRL